MASDIFKNITLKNDLELRIKAGLFLFLLEACKPHYQNTQLSKERIVLW